MGGEVSFPDLRHPQAAIFSNPLLLQAHRSDDAQACASLLQEALPLLELIPQGPASSWWYYGANYYLSSLMATAWTAKPMRVAFGDRHDRIAILGYGGEQSLRQDSRNWSCNTGNCLVMAASAFTMETSLSSAVAFSLSDEKLMHAALTMGGYHQQPDGWQEIVAKAHGWRLPSDPAAPSLLAALQTTMDMVGQLSRYGSGLLDALQLDDMIYRLLAAMMLPDLREEKALDRLLHRQRQGRDAFDELIDYIKDNLGKQLTLTILESRSHYSRRALQYAFAERLGCSATHWIKNQRLDLARCRLENPLQNDTVGKIAIECGYRSLGLFSVDFQQRFHVKPSQLLRESRRS